DFEVERVGLQEDEILRQQSEDKPEDLKPRPPVVTIMGHVDHGKTSLLDKIREARVAEGEAGGITQHIGAYHVDTSKGPLTFLDTPGHEAFTAMRARGAKVTDIVVLVVAADDGVKPQTIEAINHSKAAGVPIVVAVNKIDKPGAKPEQVRQQLTEFGLVAEEWGGDTMFVEVSAKTGDGIENLLETIALQAEVLELKANPDKAAAGIIVEARLERGRGPVATVLIQEGTLHLGDAIVAGQHFGKARAMTDDLGKPATEIGPGMPVELLGLSGVPSAGDFFDAAANEKLAKQVAAKRAHKVRESELASLSRTSLEQLYAQISAGEAKELPVVVKADVQGSVEAIIESLEALSTQRCQVKIIHSGAGGVNESDVNLAAASNAIIVAFNVRPERMAAEIADDQKIQIKNYTVIYDLIDDITAAMEGLLEPDRHEHVTGHAEIREVYTITKVGKVAGCYVTDGKATRAAHVRILRDNTQIYENVLSSLKRFKDDAKEVPAGMECGLTVKDYSDLKVGDVLEFYEIEEVAVKLEDIREQEEAAARARAKAEAEEAESQQAST
ncbi:MAG: translation initiation factor IF-2, partial [Chrysiogenetes bacterium]|nr:translation initiation factor IF-2 [Chrysiogenetes bacterium]